MVGRRPVTPAFWQTTINMMIAMKAPSRSIVCALALAVGLTCLSGCTREPSPGPPLTKVVINNAPDLPPPVVAPQSFAAAPPAPVSPAPVSPATASTSAETAQADAPTAIVAPERIPLPPVVAEVVDLAQAQVGDSVLLEYIAKSTTPFELSADQIIYLKDIGLSEQVLSALVARGDALRGAALTQALPADAAPVKPAAPTEVVPAPAAAQAAAPVYVENAPAPPPPPPQGGETVYSQPVTQVTQNYFYTALAPYGGWVEIPSYGWCWRPTVAVVDPFWRPYCHGGRWLFTDGGWYWQSSYSWGWAPFHYGTWYMSPACGWVWVPGYTWAPAWVTWRYTDAYCGWAPLPPGCGWSTGIGLTFHGSRVSVGFSFGLGWDCFSFVHYRHFYDPHPYRHRLPRHEIASVFHNSRVINDYKHERNHGIVNHGIAPSRITSVTRTEIRKVQIRDVTGEPNAPRRADRLEHDGRELAVYRPQPTAASAGGGAPVSRHTQDARQTATPQRVPAASSLSATTAPLRPPMISGGARTDSPQPARPATAPATRPTQAAPAPATVGQANRTVTQPSRTSPAPVTRAVPSQPSRVERVPATPATRPSSGSGDVRPSAPTTRSAPSTATPPTRIPATRSAPLTTTPDRSPATRSAPSAATPSRGATPAAPVYAPRSSPPTAPVSRTPASSVAPSQSRPVQSAAPSSAQPRPSGQQGSIYRTAPVTVSPSVGPPMSTRPAPAYNSSRGSSAVRSAAPSYGAPPQSAPSRSVTPPSSAPSRSSVNAPMQSAPRSGASPSGSGGRGRATRD
ncbi:MAG: hypothetical protein BWX48_00496 [Verrucomicrobia bacterium ADurb.Bin006]|nr:MAG: hypothetical protein BWX48_00496 [Verrucomicrobia bacterium ADurb.Bin006]